MEHTHNHKRGHKSAKKSEDWAIPLSKALESLRQFGGRSGKAMAGAVLAVASGNIGREDIKQDDTWAWTGTPTTSQSTHLRQQEKAFEDSFNKLSEAVQFEIATHEVLEHGKVNTRYGNPEALGPYAAPSFMAVISDKFFILSPGSVANKTVTEMADAAAQRGKTLQGEDDIRNKTTLLGLTIEQDFHSGELGAAGTLGGIAIDSQDTENRRALYIQGCSMFSTPFHTDRNELVRMLSGVRQPDYITDIDLELHELRQYVDNHELAHCVTNQIGSMDFQPEDPPVWYDEGIADLYATARHFQLNGDDGFTQKVMAMRETSAMITSMNKMKHYSSPVLERALPHLQEAYENGELENLDPQQLMAFIGDRVFNNPEEPDVFKNITAEHTSRQKAYLGVRYSLSFGPESPEVKMLMEKLDVTAEDIQSAKEAYAESRGQLFRKLDKGEDAAWHYEDGLRHSVEDMLNQQPDIHQAYAAAAFKVRHTEKKIAALQGANGLSEADALKSQGAAGLARGRELEIYEGYKQLLETQITRQQENTPQKQPEQPEPFPGS